MLSFGTNFFTYVEIGIPGLKASLLEEFGIRLVTYDLPGFGESDPHPNRNLQSSALDMLQLSYAVNVTEKFWVLGYSGGSMHAWAALRYIPDRVAGILPPLSHTSITNKFMNVVVMGYYPSCSDVHYMCS